MNTKRYQIKDWEIAIPKLDNLVSKSYSNSEIVQILRKDPEFKGMFMTKMFTLKRPIIIIYLFLCSSYFQKVQK